VDVTGLQTFAVEYLNGMPLGTFSNWGWRSFSNPDHYELRDMILPYDSHGRVPYANGWGVPGHSLAASRIQEAVTWLRKNPHRIDLGRIDFILRKSSGKNASLADRTDIHQQLNLLTGRIESRFVQKVPLSRSQGSVIPAAV
jgi:hypothetical protein